MLVLAKAIAEKMSPVPKSSSNDVGFHLQMALAIIFVVIMLPTLDNLRCAKEAWWF
jgi:hypothetical protein